MDNFALLGKLTRFLEALPMGSNCTLTRGGYIPPYPKPSNYSGTDRPPVPEEILNTDNRQIILHTHSGERFNDIAQILQQEADYPKLGEKKLKSVSTWDGDIGTAMDTAHAFNRKIRDQYRSGILFHAVFDTQSGDLLFRHTKAEDTPPLRRLTPANFNETIADICYNLAKENSIDPERNYRAGTKEYAFVNALQKTYLNFCLPETAINQHRPTEPAPLAEHS